MSDIRPPPPIVADHHTAQSSPRTTPSSPLTSNEGSPRIGTQSTLPASRNTGRVHWDGRTGDNAATARRRQLNGPPPAIMTTTNGNNTMAPPPVQIQSPSSEALLLQPDKAAAPAPPPFTRTTSGSVNRHNHPGPLLLDLRLGPGASIDAATAPVQTAPIIPPQDEATYRANRLVPPPLVHQPATTADGISAGGAHSLDEQGLDQLAFSELRDQLERHESRADHRASNVGGSGVAGQDSQLRQRGRRNRAGGADTPVWAASGSGATSGASTPGGYTTDSSYDAANDSDLDHIDFIHGEVDGMPTKPKKKKGEEAEPQGQSSGWSRVRSLLRRGTAVEAPQSPDVERGEKLPIDQGGPTNTKSVEVTTSSGTRGGDRARHRPTRHEREAARLVKAHQLLHSHRTGAPAPETPGGTTMSLPPIASSLLRAPSMRRDHLPADSGASTPDMLDTQQLLDARPVTSGGVLGNLLRLYDAQTNGGISSGDNTGGTTTAADSNAPSRVSSEVHSEVHTPDIFPPQFSVGEGRSTRGGTGDSSPARRIRGKDGRPRLAPTASSVAIASKKVVQAVAADVGVDAALDERPKASRSAAGTIGGLIATTGNLIGAVSPNHAQLGPNPKRPGYTLQRYLLPELDAKTLKKTAQIVADAAPRPRSIFVSQPPTPRGEGAHSPDYLREKDKDTTSETNVGSGSPSRSGSASPAKKRPASILGLSRTAEPVTPGLPSAASQGQHHHGWNFHFGKTQTPGGLMSSDGHSMTHSRKQSSNAHFHVPGMGVLTRPFTHSNVNTPAGELSGDDYFALADISDKVKHDEREKAEWARKVKRRAKDKRKREEIFITMHVAAILQRQEYLLKLSRALMMFGAPTHRIETQIQQTARVLEINCRAIYLPNLMLLAFGDDATHTSETKFIKQGSALDLTKLTDMHSIWWSVIHDKVGVAEASTQLDELMRRKPVIRRWAMILIGGFCSAFICVGPMGFNGSFIDALAAFPLGCFLVFCQIATTTELFSNVFEIVFCVLNSFVAAALHHTGYFCYSAVVSGSIVLILPGFIVLSGSLELQSKNLIAGSVRLVYALIYSLFLGFGLSIGSAFWLLVSGDTSLQNQVNTSQCRIHDPSRWWMSDVSILWALLTVPGYSICLSLRNQVKVNRKEFPIMVAIACSGWAANHFAATNAVLTGRQDMTSAIGSFVVGALSNIYGRIFDGRAFVVAVPGILYQLPSGLSNGGLLNFASAPSNSTSASTSNNQWSNSGFSVATSLIEVALGLTVGLFAATTIAYLVGGRKIRGGGLFSF